MTLRDLSQWFDEHLDYPLPSKKHPHGRTYVVPSPDPKTGAWLAAMADLGTTAAYAQVAMEQAAADKKTPDPALLAQLSSAQDAVAALRLDDEGEKTLYQRVLGDAYGEMVADEVPWLLIQRAGQDAYLCFAVSQQAADQALQDAVGKAAAADQPQPQEEISPARPGTRNVPARKGGSRSSRASTPTPARTRKTGTGTRGTGASSSTPAPTPAPVTAVMG